VALDVPPSVPLHQQDCVSPVSSECCARLPLSNLISRKPSASNTTTLARALSRAGVYHRGRQDVDKRSWKAFRLV